MRMNNDDLFFYIMLFLAVFMTFAVTALYSLE